MDLPNPLHMPYIFTPSKKKEENRNNVSSHNFLNSSVMKSISGYGMLDNNV